MCLCATLCFRSVNSVDLLLFGVRFAEHARLSVRSGRYFLVEHFNFGNIFQGRLVLKIHIPSWHKSCCCMPLWCNWRWNFQYFLPFCICYIQIYIATGMYLHLEHMFTRIRRNLDYFLELYQTNVELFSSFALVRVKFHSSIYFVSAAK